MSIIDVDNVSFNYGSQQVLADLSFCVEGGSFLGIVGPNGCGKSTLLKLLCGLLKADYGEISIDSKSVRSSTNTELAQKVAVVRQEFVPAFGYSVFETVMMARTTHFGALGFEREQDNQIVERALSDTDTSRFGARQLDKLSGGERQRVFIARALAQDTNIVMLDEPTSYLDLKHRVGIFDLLKKMQTENGKTIVTITHDINLAIQYCNQVLLIGPNCSYCIGAPDKVFSKEKIEEIFDVRTIECSRENAKFYLPMGEYAHNYRP